MDLLMQSLKIGVNEKLYIKDPESSTLGKNIIEHSILMIDELGFDSFTFKKLGVKINSNESSIYRYFENKHKLLLYLATWYWGWVEYRMVFATNGIDDPVKKLEKAVEVLTQNVEEDSTISHVNEVVLNRIIINEYSKSYLVKEVNQEDKDSFFIVCKRLVNRLSDMISAVDQKYPYPISLASNVMEGSLHQYFLKEHFPTLTNCNSTISPTEFFTDLIFRTLNKK
ncbi:MAG: TetR/AcrR family transcriptional regulator [Allomuricauda sp.]|jgi:AcrR family transcriptional regulator|uniref:TetR/AcrR family transcriptional regulator n=1 Tax=Flagellimonas sp. MMG031 TaxID=3158549 RepID=A0AAU7MYR2_9FLAO|nr:MULTISPECIES: TetR/AcrR family transcriptional regulator [unclassified Allomuricauda]MBO6531501.1 TetR/AcrR family transcriptional regulator [Allomuricauda sp.]MBO6587724.1 TetR/AcrR family transcriptional regulator [Allomuricauda sp.]MBO6617349.1 TetR/AcrR family transcriptional regulator [Allomuricauda sp.]MBO6643640.1 TetR/AcrR family transcriptional regulator [Allomuricauda sp.]MBO6745684.1 TetR/AcrR family transcriptional regulator [Allomuricauda sp.]